MKIILIVIYIYIWILKISNFDIRNLTKPNFAPAKEAKTGS